MSQNDNSIKLDHKASEVLGMIKEHSIKNVNYRFTSLKGDWLQTTQWGPTLSKNNLVDGCFISGSLPGWQDISDSDLFIKPDLSQCFIDSCNNKDSHPELVIICNIYDPRTQKPYHKDPRNVAIQAEKLLLNTKIATNVEIGPELEFFTFDDVSYDITEQGSYIRILQSELNKKHPIQNNQKKRRHPVRNDNFLSPHPHDSFFQLRTMIMEKLHDMNIKPYDHKHEMAPNQSEIGIQHDGLLQIADKIQLSKHIINSVCESNNLVCTYMPKPLPIHPGNGHHINISLWKENQNLFVNNDTLTISDLGKYFIGGVLKHLKALNCLTNPTVNSYKRLADAFFRRERAGYSFCNRLTAVRIPAINNSNEMRIEVRFPDSSCNPYLAYSAILMAGIDGIKHNIDPGAPITGSPLNTKITPIFRHKKGLARDLYEAAEYLHNDRAFLTSCDVFSDEIIDAHLIQTINHAENMETIPAPLDFKTTFSC